MRAARHAQYEANKTEHLRQAKVRWEERKHLYEPARQKWAVAHRDEQLEITRVRGVEYRAWIDSLKAGSPCPDCGLTFPSYVMEYDHVRGEKRYNIGRMTNHKRERVLQEIEKCDLVCCVCHRIRTHQRRSPSRIEKLRAFRAWVDGLKSTPCRDCTRVFHPVAMDFDHLVDKTVQISDMWSWSRSRVEAEIAKCELVCANCHRVRTVARIRAPSPRDASIPSLVSTADRGEQ